MAISVETLALARKYADQVAAAGIAGKVTLTKAETADTGYAATYIFAQGGDPLDTTGGKLTKINIPKDFLVRSATLETVETEDVPYSGAKVGDKYIDFVINTKDSSETAEHLYLPVNDLFDSYTSGSQATDAVVIVVDNTTNKISATVTDATIARAKITSEFESDIAKMEGALQKAADGTYKTVSTRVDEEAANATFKAATETTAKVTIKDAIEALDSKVDDLNAEIDQDANAEATYAANTGLTLHIKEEGGVITEFSGSIDTVTPAQINGLFPA